MSGIEIVDQGVSGKDEFTERESVASVGELDTFQVRGEALVALDRSTKITAAADGIGT